MANAKSHITTPESLGRGARSCRTVIELFDRSQVVEGRSGGAWSQQPGAVGRACWEVLEDRRLLSFSPATSFPVGAESAGGGDGRLQQRRQTRPGHVELRRRHRRRQRQRAAGQRRRQLPAGSDPSPPARTRGPSPSATSTPTASSTWRRPTRAVGENNDVSILLGNGDGTFAAPVGRGASPRTRGPSRPATSTPMASWTWW